MLLNAMTLAFRAIRRNMMRSSLTTLGIVIGVAAVIVMVTLGNGATAQVTADISSMGSNILTVMPGQRRGPGGAANSAKPFKEADVEALIRDMPSLAAVAPQASKSMSAIYGNENRSTTVRGTTNDYFTASQWRIATGRIFTDAELRSGKAACILGTTVRTDLFGPADPIGREMRLQGLSCEVIGVLESKGKNAMGMDRDDCVILPLRTFQRRISGSTEISEIQVSFKDTASSEQVQRDIGILMRERRKLAASAEDDFSIMDMAELAAMLTGTTRILTGLLAAVAAVSLLVGGIGIMNIMLVSVTERTREIGIRLAIGALEREVLTQFLVEAVVLSAFGGLIGVSLAVIASVFAARAMRVPFVFDIQIVILAFLFSAAVGVVFGFFPARRAASLNPIDALRHE
jgi:putative ABC transport system permease protein